MENRYCQIVAKLRDLIISNSTDEFLRRYYKYQEIVERIPKIAKYYRNYLLFFCKPVFTNLFINKLIHVYGELKGELYYNANYGNKNKDKEKDKDKEENNNNNNNNRNINQNVNNNNNNNYKNFNKQNNSEMLFHTTIKNDIDKNSMTISTIVKDVSYLNMNPLNADFFSSNEYHNKNISNNAKQFNNINHQLNNQEARIGAAAPNRGNYHSAKNAVFNSNKANAELFNEFNKKINFASVAVNNNNNTNNNNNNRNNNAIGGAGAGNITKRGATSKKKSDNNAVECFNNYNNNNLSSNFNRFGNNDLVFNEKLSMNIKAELGNLYNNLLNSNANVNGYSGGTHNRNNGNFFRKEANKKGKCTSANSNFKTNLIYFCLY